MKELILIRGLCSSGKTTKAKEIIAERGGVSTCIDDFLTDEHGVFHFDSKVRHKAIMVYHDWVRLLLNHYDLVICHNTYTCRWEMESQIQLAKDMGAELTVIDLSDGGCSDEELFERNTHGVPLKWFKIMRDRYEHDWQNADPRPPWKRKEKKQ